MLCFNGKETHEHLFLHCEVAWKLWTDIFNMFGIAWVFPPTVESFLATFFGWEGLRKNASLCSRESYLLACGVLVLLGIR